MSVISPSSTRQSLLVTLALGLLPPGAWASGKGHDSHKDDHAKAEHKEDAPMKGRAHGEDKEITHKKGLFAEPEKETAADKLNAKTKCERLPQATEADLWNLSDCFFQIGVTQTATEILMVILQKNPKSIEAYATAAWLRWQEGQSLGGAQERRLTEDAVSILEKARISNPTHWGVDTEIGDFYYLRMNEPERAYASYVQARKHYDGDYARNVPKAPAGRKAAIENRIARSAEILGRKGEAVEASCRALYWDPDDPAAASRLKKLEGSCTRKKVRDPREEEAEKEAAAANKTREEF